MYNLYLRANGRVSTDSRSIEPGALFFALRGGAFDGNRYAEAALQAGALAAVVDDPSLKEKEGLVWVPDALAALQELAAEHRRALGIPIVGLTGSNGKTTTKEFLKRTLGTKYRVGATVGNLNNHIGVPLTLLNFTHDVEIGIVEMGASAVGEIADLCRIAQPSAGLVTNVGRCHLEGFGGPEGVRKGKGELFDYLAATGGVVFYNEQDPVVSAMVAERQGFVERAPYSADGIELNLFGGYNAVNAAAAVAVAEFFGVEREKALEAVGGYVPDNKRSQVVETPRGNTLIVDCYNANPTSMGAALDEFSAFGTRPRWAVLGQMGELGDYAQEEHRKIAAQALQTTENAVFIGPNFRPFAGNALWFETTEEATAYLETHPIAGASILIKGSRSTALERILTLL